MLCSPFDLSFLAAALYFKPDALGTFVAPIPILITINAVCVSLLLQSVFLIALSSLISTFILFGILKKSLPHKFV